eukprot:GHVN01060106.1.p1 GENE.GHVN01060106.1~~GHVN01060106.1.p1  ORF type:complete len:188 (+),score=22.46 GHVN01060106.1:402-965(+)
MIGQAHWGPFDETIISTHQGGYVMVWDLKSRQPIREFKAHKENVQCVSMSEDRLLMLTCAGGSDRSAQLWETHTFEKIKTYESDRPLNACDISPAWNNGDHRRPHILIGGGQEARDVAESGTEGKFQAVFHHLIYGGEIGQVKGHFGPINSLKYMPDGRGFASGGEEGTTRLWRFDDECWNKFEEDA